MPRVRSDCLLNKLPPVQAAALERWLFEEKISYREAAARLLAEFSVSCWPDAVGKWWQRKEQARFLADIESSQKTKNAVLEKFAANPADSYSALLEVAGKIAFDVAMNEKQFDPELVFNFTKLVMQGKKQAMEADKLALDTRRVELLEKKAAQADAARLVTTNPALTPEQREAEYRRIFGMS